MRNLLLSQRQSTSINKHSMSFPLLTTKLYIPHVPIALVERPRLVEKLNQGLVNAARLLLIAAPAGFGKSTLVAAWLRTQTTPAAWLALDAQDNEPLRFLTYLIATIQHPLPGFGAELLAQLQGGMPPAPETICALLVNALAPTPTPLLLVLDDYHLITNPAIHENVAFLLEHLPAGVTFIIATRVMPPLPVARLRARQQLVEIRLQELRFTSTETAHLLNDRNALALDDHALATLEARTEGWVAGLQLSVLALQADTGDRQHFLAHFSGSHEFIADYLIEEVLNRQSPAVTDFLLHTAILDRFCASLCAAVTAASASEPLLDDLLTRNVFLIPLDAERCWFRYHHLFADLLRARLTQSQRTLIPELHQRASAWFAANGLVNEAMTHALAAGDWATAARLVNDNWSPMLHQGQISTILRWLAALPPTLFASYPGLHNAYAWALFLKGEVMAVEAHLQQTEQVLHALCQSGHLSESATEYRQATASTQMLRAFVLYAHRDLTAAYAQTQHALPSARLAGALLEGGLHIVTGHICRELGRREEAIQHYQTGIPLSWQQGNIIAALNAYTALSRLYRQGRQYHQAEQTCQEALALVCTQKLEQIPAAGLLYLEQAELWFDRQRPTAAQQAVERALAVGRSGGLTNLLAAGEALRARLASTAPSTPAPPTPAQTGLLEPLTSREVEVLVLLANGDSNQEIAKKLVITLPTVKKHTSSILAKLAATSRTQAVAYARQRGLL